MKYARSENLESKDPFKEEIRDTQRITALLVKATEAVKKKDSNAIESAYLELGTFVQSIKTKGILPKAHSIADIKKREDELTTVGFLHHSKSESEKGILRNVYMAPRDGTVISLVGSSATKTKMFN